MISLPNVTLTGARQIIFVPIASTHVYDRVILANQSPLTLDITSGTQAIRIQPFQIDILKLESTSITINPTNPFGSLSTVPVLEMQAVARGEETAAFPQSTQPNTGVAPNLVPNQQPVRGSRAGVGTVNIIPAVAGVTLYLFNVQLIIFAAVVGGAATLQDTGATIYAEKRCDAIGDSEIQLGGTQLPTGLGLQLVISGAGGSANAYVTWSKA